MHIAMVSIPAHGHVNPSLEVIRTLAARGHRVTYANAPSFERAVRATGAEFKPYRSTLPSGDDEWPDDLAAALDIFLDDAIAMLPQLIAAYDDDRPDLFLYDIAAAPARLLAERWGVPAVQLSPTMVAWEGYEDEVPDLRSADYTRRYASWLAANGSSVTDSLAFQGRPPRCLALIPEALQPHVDRVDREVYSFVGPILGDRGSWDQPAGADKVLLVSLGSEFTDHPDFYRRCIAAFGELPGWHTVLQIGRHVAPAALGPVPPAVEVHPWVPQLAVLRQADAFLTHAGMGGSAEGLACGTPMIAAPQAADQFDNADRLVALGVAHRVDLATVTADELRAALLALTEDPAVLSRSAELRRQVRDQAGAERAADLIEEAAVSARSAPGARWAGGRGWCSAAAP